MSASPARSSPDETIFTVLAERARRTPDWRLALYTGTGVLAIGLVIVVPSARWPLIAPSALLVAFGVWGIADRELGESARTGGLRPAWRRALLFTKTAAVGIGTAAAVSTMLIAMVVIMGHWRL